MGTWGFQNQQGGRSQDRCGPRAACVPTALVSAGSRLRGRCAAPATSGEVCGAMTCHYDFRGNVYVPAIAQPLSFISHENRPEINGSARRDGAPRR